MSNKIKTIKLLLHKNIDINYQNKVKLSGLMFTCMYGNLKTFKLLVKHKADVEA